jgi:hypothetical protein
MKAIGGDCGINTFLLGESLVGQCLLEVSIPAVLGDDVDVVGGLDEVNKSDDVGMVELLEDLGGY